MDQIQPITLKKGLIYMKYATEKGCIFAKEHKSGNYLCFP